VLRLDLLDELTDGPDVTLPTVGPDDPAQIQYTSGTTGFPKGVMLRHSSIVNNARLWGDRVGIPDGAGMLVPMPLFHTAGCVMGVLGALDTRSKLALMPIFEPGLFLELIELERPWYAGGVPTMLIAAMEHPDASRRDLSSWKSAVSGGSQVPETVVRRIEDALGVDFTIVYGQTECSPVVTNSFPSDSPEDKGLTIGQPLPHTEIRIVDPDSLETVPIGSSGELWVRGYLTMLGYFDMPEASAKTLTADGWVRTGDLATMDERGYCGIVGRLKDMIIRGGENLFPPRSRRFSTGTRPSQRWRSSGCPTTGGARWSARSCGCTTRMRRRRLPSCAPICGLISRRRRHPPGGTPSRAFRSPDPARSRSSRSARRGKRGSATGTRWSCKPAHACDR
jgi:fatty-acyl-CoA synthase